MPSFWTSSVDTFCHLVNHIHIWFICRFLKKTTAESITEFVAFCCCFCGCCFFFCFFFCIYSKHLLLSGGKQKKIWKRELTNYSKTVFRRFCLDFRKIWSCCLSVSTSKEGIVSTYLALGSEGNQLLKAFCEEGDPFHTQFYVLPWWRLMTILA